MHVITRRHLVEAGKRHAGLADPLDAWYRITKRAQWKNLAEARRDFPTADSVGKLTVFNIKGNTFRLIVEIFYASQVVLVRHVLTHADYDKGKWK